MKILHVTMNEFKDKESVLSVLGELDEVCFLALSKQAAERLVLANEGIGRVFWIDNDADANLLILIETLID